MSTASERGLPFISAYNDAAVVAGGGTIALEIVEDLPSMRITVVPAGGGGLIGGIGVATHGLNPEIAIYGVQSTASPALHAATESWRSGPGGRAAGPGRWTVSTSKAGSITLDCSGSTWRNPR